MPDDITTVPAAVEEATPIKPATSQKIDKGQYQIVQDFFTGDKVGFNFNYVEFKRDTEEQAQASVEAAKQKYTGQQLVGLFNSALKGGQRVKAQNELNKLKQYKERPHPTVPNQTIEVDDVEGTKSAIEKRRQENPTLLSIDDADNWKPGIRELTPQGMLREAARLASEGKGAEAMELLMRAQTALNSLVEAEAAEAEAETTQ